MKHLSQPPGSPLCGQTCVAMIAGITLEESIKVFGKKGATSAKDVINALRKLGFSCDDRRTRLGDTIPNFCLVTLKYDGAPKSHWHWVVFYNGFYYDPCEYIGTGYKSGVRKTSYLTIYPTEYQEAKNYDDLMQTIIEAKNRKEC